MGLFSLPVRLPLMPLRGVLWLGETLRDEAERQQRDPAAVRRELEEAEAEAQAGNLTQDELSRVQEAATARIIGPAAAGGRRGSGRRGDHSAGRGRDGGQTDTT
jgi:hypothetical protein